MNGSGSASANSLFAKAVLRMGVASTPRNIFPSNIQGLPTWYEVRVSEAGHLGARGGGVDLMVAMNPQTWDEDVRSIVPGGYLFYDNTKPMPAIEVPRGHRGAWRAADRNDQRGVHRSAAAPVVQEHRRTGLRWRRCWTWTSPAIEQLLADQFKGRDKLIAANVQALHMGIDWVREQHGVPDRVAHAPRQHGRRPDFHRRQRRRGAGRGVRRRDGLRVVSDHAVLVAGRGVHALQQPDAPG